MVRKNGVTQYSRTLATVDADGPFGLMLTVAAGDALDFVINAGAANDVGCDSTTFDPIIAYTSGAPTASATYSSSTQEANAWSYFAQSLTPPYALTPMTPTSISSPFLSETTAWNAGPDSWLWSWGGHPTPGSDSVRRWTAPAAGTVRIAGSASDADPNCGDGVVVSIRKGASTLWTQPIANGDSTGVSYDLTTSVAQGDAVDFVINAGPAQNHYCDSTSFNPSIAYTMRVSNSQDATYCVAEDLTGQHPRQVTYQVEKLYDPALSTLASQRSAAATLQVPFAWGWADLHAHMFAEKAFGAQLQNVTPGGDWHKLIYRQTGLDTKTTQRKRYGLLHGTFEGDEATALTSCGEHHGNTYSTRTNASWSEEAPASASDVPNSRPNQSSPGKCQLPNSYGCLTLSDLVQNSVPDVNASHISKPAAYGSDGADYKDRHFVDGYPNYTDWPHAQIITHQQMWNGWVKRAHKYGLRMVTMMAVSDAQMCYSLLQAKNHDVCKDGNNAKVSLDAARAYAAANPSWFQIVTTPAEARNAIAQGKLAVVLGLELDDLLGDLSPEGSAKSGTCTLDPAHPCPYNTDALVRSRIQYWYDLGVRHVFPVHLVDNAIGGSAMYSPYFVGASWQQNGSNWPGAALKPGTLDAIPAQQAFNTNAWSAYGPDVNSNDCSTTPAAAFDEYGSPLPISSRETGMETRSSRLPEQNAPPFQFNDWNFVNYVANMNVPGVDPVWAAMTYSRPNYYPPPDANHATRAQCNGLGLTALGRMAVKALMDEGMLIDVDHISAVARRQIYALSDSRSYPLVAGHASIHGPNYGASEMSLDYYDVKNILRWRGTIALGLRQGSDTLNPALPTPPNGECTDRPTSRSYAHQLMNLWDIKQTLWSSGDVGHDSFFAASAAGVPFGSDFNGLINLPEARTAPACGGTAFAYGASLLRPAHGTSTVNLTPWQSQGGVTFDYNTRGVATVGQLPEFVADLNSVGLNQNVIDPLYRGAESFLRSWEQAEWSSGAFTSNSGWRVSTASLTAAAASSPALDDSGWAAAVDLGPLSSNKYGALPADGSGSAGIIPATTSAHWISASSACGTSCAAGTTWFRRKLEVKGSWDNVDLKQFRFLGSDMSDQIIVYFDGVEVAWSDAAKAGYFPSFRNAAALAAAQRTEGTHVLTVQLNNYGASTPAAFALELK